MSDLEGDLRLQLPNNFLVVGPSQAGKSYLLFNEMLCKADTLFAQTIGSVYIYYQVWTDQYGEVAAKLRKTGIMVHFITDINDVSDTLFKEAQQTNPGKQTLMILDDSSGCSDCQHLAVLATKCRHFQVSMIFLWHRLYFPSAASRLIQANVQYIILLQSPRLHGQIKTFASQYALPHLLSAYEKAGENPDRTDRALLIDFTTETPKPLRLRSSFTQDTCVDIYVPCSGA